MSRRLCINKRIFTRNMNNLVNHPKAAVVVDKIGFVTTIGINRPEKRNCVNNETANLLRKAIENFENDDSSYAAVLHGIGGNFCAGYDLDELSQIGTNSKDLLNCDGTMGPTLRYIKKPMVAAISGYAVAGGLELALMCDMRVVEDTAVLGVYCRRFGVPLIDGGTVRLQAMVGLSRALDLILTGRSLHAKEAFEWGLANRIVACGTSLGQGISLATSLIKFPQKCLLTDRNSTYNAAFNRAYQELLSQEQNAAIGVIAEESIDGARKFMSGIGRHGSSTNLTEIDNDKYEWEDGFVKKTNSDNKSKL